MATTLIQANYQAEISEAERSLEEAHTGKITHWDSVDNYFQKMKEN